jgi:hypothetical protein
MNEQLEPEILSYREFRKRETLLAWERRRRAVESQPARPRGLLIARRRQVAAQPESFAGAGELDTLE